MALQRIHIIGGPGSGKTTIAHQLAEKLGVKHTDLDGIMWDNSVAGYGTKRAEVDRDTLLAQAVAQERWVIEGVYDKWVGPSFAKANVVLVVDTPLWIRQARILKRSLRRLLGIEKGKSESIKSVKELLAWNAEYDKKNRPRFLATLAAMGANVRVCQNDKEVVAAIKEIVGVNT